jgi:hypothetical protein
MAFVRYILIFIIGYLIVRFFIRLGDQTKPPVQKPETRYDPQQKRISKETGEYVDFEDVRKEKERHR